MPDGARGHDPEDLRTAPSRGTGSLGRGDPDRGGALRTAHGARGHRARGPLPRHLASGRPPGAYRGRARISLPGSKSWDSPPSSPDTRAAAVMHSLAIAPGSRVIASFGIVDPIKQPHKLATRLRRSGERPTRTSSSALSARSAPSLAESCERSAQALGVERTGSSSPGGSKLTSTSPGWTGRARGAAAGDLFRRGVRRGRRLPCRGRAPHRERHRLDGRAARRRRCRRSLSTPPPASWQEPVRRSSTILGHEGNWLKALVLTPRLTASRLPPGRSSQVVNRARAQPKSQPVA